MSFAKPLPADKPAKRGIDRRPDCACDHAARLHTPGVEFACEAPVGGSLCACNGYVPRPRLSRSAPVRKDVTPKPCYICKHSKAEHYDMNADGCSGDGPTKYGCGCMVYQEGRRKDVKPKRKILPKCKHCAHPFSKHWDNSFESAPAGEACSRCAACPDYERSIGIRQKRRTPTAAIREIADALWSKLVKIKGACEVQRFYPHTCGGGLQAMHGIPRTFSATRWLPIDGFSGCRDIHKYMTDRPELWSAVLLDAWGEPTFRELWALARSSQKPDMDATVAALRAELAKEKE